MLNSRDRTFLEAFENGSLAAEEFDHEGHVYAAWCCLRQYGDSQGREKFVAALKQFVDVHDAADKYHETMTRAFLHLIAGRDDGRSGWPAFRRRHRVLIEEGLEEVLRHYSRERLFSERARRRFVDPDRRPFPSGITGSGDRAGRSPMKENSAPGTRKLRSIPGVGPSIERDLLHLGYRDVGDLAGAEPETMYAELCRLRGARVDRCVLYVFRCAVYYANHDTHDPELLKWWHWKDRRDVAR